MILFKSMGGSSSLLILRPGGAGYERCPMNQTMKRIVVIDDHPIVVKMLSNVLSTEYALVGESGDGEGGMRLAQTLQPDLVILDLGLPRLDGLTLLRRIRHRGRKTPVLVLTARVDIESRVQGLDLGADDYLPKPFALPELEARVRALLRRASDSLPLLEAGPLRLDPDHRQASLHGQPLSLSARETDLLEALMQRAGQVVLKNRLALQLSEWDAEIGSNAIEVYIHRLRKKIEKGPIRIATVRGLGYCLEKISP